MPSQYAIILYFVIAFAFTWAFHFQLVWRQLPPNSGFGRWLYMLGLPGPLVAALIVAGLDRQVGRLLAEVSNWRVAIGWYLMALLAVPAIQLAGSALHSLLSGQGFAVSFHRPSRGWLGLLVAQAYVVLSEEIGWRGFALPLLIARWGSLGGTLILGVLWALWHLPMFRVTGSNQQGSVWSFVFELTVWSLIMTVIFVGSGGGLPACMLFHAAANSWYFTATLPARSERSTAFVYLVTALAMLALLAAPLVLLQP